MVFQMFQPPHLFKGKWKLVTLFFAWLLSVYTFSSVILMTYGDDELDEMSVGGVEEDFEEDGTSEYFSYENSDSGKKNKKRLSSNATFAKKNSTSSKSASKSLWQPKYSKDVLPMISSTGPLSVQPSFPIVSPNINQLFSNQFPIQSTHYGSSPDVPFTGVSSTTLSTAVLQDPLRVRSRTDGVMPSPFTGSAQQQQQQQIALSNNHHHHHHSNSIQNSIQNNSSPYGTMNPAFLPPQNSTSSNSIMHSKPIVSNPTSAPTFLSDVFSSPQVPQEEAGYMVPRFPTKYHVLPSFNPPPQCTKEIKVSDITDGKVESLKNGGLQVSYNMYQQKLRFYAFGKPRYSTRNLLKFPYWAYKKLFTRVQEFTSVEVVPAGCVVYPQDGNILHTVSQSGAYTTGGTLQLSAEEYALYTPVDIPPPIDIAENIQYGKQDFKMVGPCIMSGHFPVAPHQIVVSSSILNVSIIIQTPKGTEVLQATYPEVCLPLFFNRIAAWVLPITDGSTVLIATSPPIVVGDRQEQWKLVPVITEDALKSHAYVTAS